MALSGSNLGDSIRGAIDDFKSALVGDWTTGNMAARLTGAFRALGGAIVDHLVGNPYAGAGPGLVPAKGGASNSDVLRANGTWGAAGSGASLADGDYGDVTVSGSGAVMTVDDLVAKAPLASPALTGVPTAPTAAAATNTTQIATTAFVRTEVANLVAAAPGVLDTLDELAAALGDDPAFATTVTSALAGKQAASSALSALATLGAAASAGIWRQTGTDTVVRLNDTAAGRAVLEAADAAAQRTALGLGTAALVNTGTAAGNVPTIAQADARYLGIGDQRWQHGGILPPWCPTSTSTGTQRDIGSAACPAWYFGRAPRAITAIDAVLKVISTMTAVSVTWAEMFVAKGSYTAVGNQTLTVVGYTTIASLTATNVVTTTVNVAGGQSIAAGDDLWWGFAKLATTTPGFRGASFGDDMLRGLILDGGNVRPSSILGIPTAFAAVTAASPWWIVFPH